jgi:hypothetical protein
MTDANAPNNPKDTVSDKDLLHTKNEILKLIQEANDPYYEGVTTIDDFSIMFPSFMHPEWNVWSCQVSVVHIGGSIPKEIPVALLESQIMSNVQHTFPECFTYNGKELQAVQLSRYDLTLIAADTASFKDGERVWINHVKRDGYWKLLMHGLNLDNPVCGWCLDSTKPVTIECKECHKVHYCSPEHMKIAKRYHALNCARYKQLVKKK